MGNLGDLSKFFTEPGKLNDLSWLDVDPGMYQNMPFDNVPEYVAIPKLEDAWKHQQDANINLVPNANFDFNYQTPEPKQDVPSLVNMVKRHMMSGKKGQDLLNIIQESAPPSLIKAARSELEKLAREQGLLGNVYIDPSIFRRCEDGAKFLEKKAKLAKYALEMPKCSDCRFNKTGRCEVYKKVVAKEIPYDENTISFYSNHVKNIIGHKIKISSKDDLRKAFLMEKPKEVRVAEFMPRDRSAAPDKTLEQKQKEFDKQLSELKTELSNFDKEKVAADLGIQLLKGTKGRALKSYINSKYSKEEFNKFKDIFSNILSKQGSLGKIYVDANRLPFSNCREAKDFFRNMKNDPTLFLVLPKRPKGPKDPDFCRCQNPNRCLNLNKDIIYSTEDIPKEVWSKEFKKYPKEITDKILKIFSSDPERGLRLAAIQEDLINYSYTPDNFEMKASSCDHFAPGNKIDKRANVTVDKVVRALEKGYPISAIISTGKKLAADNNIMNKIEKALSQIKEVKSHQLDRDIKIPENVKIITTNRTISENMSKDKSSSIKAPIDNSLNEFGLKTPDISINVKSNKEDIELSGLNEFIIE